MCLETYRPLRIFFFEIHAAQYQYLLPVLFGVIAQPPIYNNSHGMWLNLCREARNISFIYILLISFFFSLANTYIRHVSIFSDLSIEYLCHERSQNDLAACVYNNRHT